MSLMPYWIRHLRNLAYRDPVLRLFEDPFVALSRDPFFRDPVKMIRQATLPALEEQQMQQAIDGYTDHEVKVDGQKLEVHLDMQNFTPDQIQVKTLGNEIMIEGKREVKKKDGWTRSVFEKRFILPEGFPPERVECHLDKGKLLLVAFRAEPIPERVVPIQDKSAEKSDKCLESDKPDDKSS